MTDIPNTEYIKIISDGTMVGGKPAEHYRNQAIWCLDDLRMHMDHIQRDFPNIIEVHVMSSESPYPRIGVGLPSYKHGPHAWCRVRYNSGLLSGWIKVKKYYTAERCAKMCAYHSMYFLDNDTRFLHNLFSYKPDVTASLVNVLQNANLFDYAGKPLEINGYRIMIEKIAETQQIKR